MGLWRKQAMQDSNLDARVQLKYTCLDGSAVIPLIFHLNNYKTATVILSVLLNPSIAGSFGQRPQKHILHASGNEMQGECPL